MSQINTKVNNFFEKRPGMRKVYKNSGTFKDYIKGMAATIPNKNEDSILHRFIIKEAKRLLPEYIDFDMLEKQLTTHPLISYADHHSFLNYKLLYNSNLLYAELIKQLGLPYVVVFASGNVPMVNRSHPRGFYFKGRKFNFFGEKQSKLPVFLFKGKLEAKKNKGIGSICISYDKNSLTAEEEKFLNYLFFDCLRIEKASESHEVFSDQLTLLNYKLWKYYFDSKIRDSIPDIIYLQSNPLISEMLIHQLNREDSLISLILFDPKVRRLFLENFWGIPCCWGEGMGSHFFWGVIERKGKKRIIPLHLDESSNSLMGENFGIDLERATLIEALKAKKILQTSFFDLLSVIFMEGYMALGGFNQLEYLPRMQQMHIKCLEEKGLKEMAQKFKSRVTDGLICGMLPFDFDSGIDLLWHYNSNNGKFNGNLDRGLTKEDLNGLLEKNVSDMILSAIELMLANM